MSCSWNGPSFFLHQVAQVHPKERMLLGDIIRENLHSTPSFRRGRREGFGRGDDWGEKSHQEAGPHRQ